MEQKCHKKPLESCNIARVSNFLKQNILISVFGQFIDLIGGLSRYPRSKFKLTLFQFTHKINNNFKCLL